VIIIVLTIAGFVLWMIVLFGIWLFVQGTSYSTNFWSMTESLSTAVVAAGVLGAGYVAYRELSEISSGRHIEVADKLFNELNSSANIEARRWIYQNLPDNAEEGIKSMTPEGQNAMKEVLNSLDRVAFLTQGGWIPDEIVMPWMHPMICKSWLKLEPYVMFERKRRHEPYYYKYAGELAARCLEWRAKNLEQAKIEWVDDAL